MNLMCEKKREMLVPTGYTDSIREPVANSSLLRLHSNKRWFKKNIEAIKIPNENEKNKNKKVECFYR